jgi:predicted metal-dependent HD superfamily phosphohydrolase
MFDDVAASSTSVAARWLKIAGIPQTLPEIFNLIA